MRRQDKLVTDTALLNSVINKAEVCRLGLVGNNKPYIIPLSFGFDGAHIYIHSAVKGQKVDILQTNANVCLEFEQDVKVVKGESPCEWTVNYFSVIVHGTAQLLNNHEEKSYGLNQIYKHYQPQALAHNYSEQELRTVLLYKITPQEITGKRN